MKRILITGGAGFIGSNFVEHILSNDDIVVYNLDKLTYAGNLDNLRFVENHDRYHFIQGDICDRSLIEELFEKYQITDVIHFAHLRFSKFAGNLKSTNSRFFNFLATF